MIEEESIINHVAIKADIRGSTDITSRMKEEGLNPASFFSLNFFGPITEILPEYGAVKVFIEGDAIIMSIFEHDGTPAEWYSVARACGLAINMLFIVQKYNAKSKKHRLPILELGIGISFYNSSPTFLFDGGNQIMISPAINLADRLSGCSKSLRKQISELKRPFNLEVLQVASEEDMAVTSDDLFLRYNVNGIELSASGFEKLSKEIDLKALECSISDIQKGQLKIYTGKFPTVTGKYQRLVIREAHISRAAFKDLRIIENTSRKYYEVCTHPKLYEFVKKEEVRIRSG